MKLWVTRPMEDAEVTAEQLRAEGHEVLLAPLLQISALPLPPLQTADLDGVIITSRNGARRLVELTEDLELPLFAVGEATADLLRAAGFRQIFTARGDLSSLEDLFRQVLVRRSPQNRGKLLHLCGRHRAGDPTTGLAELGYRLVRLEAYESQPISRLPESVRTSIVKEQLDGVLLYSPRTARALLSVLENSNISSSCRNMVAFCLSDKIADAVRSLPWKGLETAATPQQSELLKAIERRRQLG